MYLCVFWNQYYFYNWAVIILSACFCGFATSLPHVCGFWCFLVTVVQHMNVDYTTQQFPLCTKINFTVNYVCSSQSLHEHIYKHKSDGKTYTLYSSHTHLGFNSNVKWTPGLLNHILFRIWMSTNSSKSCFILTFNTRTHRPLMTPLSTHAHHRHIITGKEAWSRIHTHLTHTAIES